MWSRTTAFEVKSTKRLQLHLSAVRTVHNANHRCAPKRPSGCTAPGQSITTVPLPWKRSQLFPDNEIAPLLRKHAGFLEHESRVSDSDPAVTRAAINQPRSGPSPLRPASDTRARVAEGRGPTRGWPGSRRRCARSIRPAPVLLVMNSRFHRIPAGGARALRLQIHLLLTSRAPVAQGPW